VLTQPLLGRTRRRSPSLLMSSRTSHNCFSCAKDIGQNLIRILGKITDIMLHDKVVDIAGDKLAADNACK
jgi:hypothetical protein